MTTFTDEEKRVEIRRELMMRRRVYPGLVSSGRIDQPTADRRIAILEAVAQDYEARDLFGKAV